MPDQLSFNYLAILTAAIVAFSLGGLWFSPALFGTAWKRELGLTDEECKKREASSSVGRVMGMAFVLELIMAFNLAAFLGAKSTLAFGTFAGAAAGFGWVALSMGVNYLFEGRSLRFFFINAGYHGLAFTFMGAILGAWH